MADDGSQVRALTGALHPSRMELSRAVERGLYVEDGESQRGVVLTAMGINVVRTPLASCSGTWKDPSECTTKRTIEKFSSKSRVLWTATWTAPSSQGSQQQQRHEAH